MLCEFLHGTFKKIDTSLQHERTRFVKTKIKLPVLLSIHTQTHVHIYIYIYIHKYKPVHMI